MGPASETHDDPSPGTGAGPSRKWACGRPPGRTHRVSPSAGRVLDHRFKRKGSRQSFEPPPSRDKTPPLCVLACKAGSQGTSNTAERQQSGPHRPRAAGTYLVPQQGRNTCFRGVADGREVVAPLQGQNDPAAGQAHQLLRQVPETCNGSGRREGRAGRAITAAAACHLTLQARAGARGS